MSDQQKAKGRKPQGWCANKTEQQHNIFRKYVIRTVKKVKPRITKYALIIGNVVLTDSSSPVVSHKKVKTLLLLMLSFMKFTALQPPTESAAGITTFKDTKNVVISENMMMGCWNYGTKQREIKIYEFSS